MIIKEQDLLNFISCPIKYLIAKNGYDIKKKTYNSLLHKSFNYLLSTYLYCGINNLDTKIHKKWDTICVENQDLISPKNVIEGWGKLYKGYEYLKYNNPNIIDLDIPYEINIDNHTLTGQLNNIIDKGSQIEVLIPSFSNKMPESYIIDYDLKNTIDSLVIKTLYNKDTVFAYYNFTYNKIRYGLRTDKDYNRLKLIINNVALAMEQNIIYPNSSYHCNSCLAKGLCNSWGLNDGLKNL